MTVSIKIIQENYVEILRDYIMPAVEEIVGHDFYYKLSEAQREQGCNLLKNFIREQRIRRLPWPSHSPDRTCLVSTQENVSKRKPRNFNELANFSERI